MSLPIQRIQPEHQATTKTEGTTMRLHSHPDRRGSIRFGTVGSYRISYSGTVSGSSMSGTDQVNGVGQGGSWSAAKA
jgi:hypothetical protein